MKDLVLTVSARLSTASGYPSRPLLAWSDICSLALSRGELSLFKDSVFSLRVHQSIPGEAVGVELLVAIPTEKAPDGHLVDEFKKRVRDEFEKALQRAQEKSSLWVEDLLVTVE